MLCMLMFKERGQSGEIPIWASCIARVLFATLRVAIRYCGWAHLRKYARRVTIWVRPGMWKAVNKHIQSKMNV
jgi:hypothetical protein